MDRDREELVRILQGAYSGELAAGLAYRGHWKSVRSVDERAAIQKIEREEAVHRKRVGEILESLDAAPLKFREVSMRMIGQTIGLSCHAIGRFLPMYFAGRLESGNVIEYENAAAHAAALGLRNFETDLLVMARVEAEHELFFLRMVAGHRLLPLMRAIFKWGEPVSAGVLPAASSSYTHALKESRQDACAPRE
jgi:demethoxyubiquinone hydroxylase (CLK1/Coq7/Cat5 family)